jgi:hypothetical protein
MKNHRGSFGTSISIPFLFGLIALFCIPVNTAQSTKSEQVVPSTTKRVALQFTFGETHNVLIGEREGRMITIENPDGFFGFTPRVINGQDGRVALKIYRITKTATGDVPEEIEEMMLSMSSSTSSTTVPSLSIKLKKVQTTSEPKKVRSVEGECCIRCEDIKICAECFECNGVWCTGEGCNWL